MSRLTFAFMLSALVCSTGFSQDSRTRETTEKRGESRVQKKRGEARGRENPRRNRTEVRRSDSDPRAAFRKRLGELIEKGKLTREEASQLYTLAFPERSRDRGAGRGTEKRYRNRRKVEVKDPAQFKTAEGKPLFSGPQPGEKIPPFQVTGLVGNFDGKKIDPVSLAGGKPQVLIFMDENRVGLRGLFGLARMVSQIKEKSDKGLHFSATLLGDDPAKLSQFGKRFGSRLSGLVMAASQDGRDGPGALGLNRTISMTVVVAKDGKVTHNFVFPQSMLYPDPHVLGAIAGAIGQKRETVAKWLNEEPAAAAPARRPSRKDLIKRFDKDGDGKLNEEEGRAARKALQRK